MVGNLYLTNIQDGRDESLLVREASWFLTHRKRL